MPRRIAPATVSLLATLLLLPLQGCAGDPSPPATPIDDDTLAEMRLAGKARGYSLLLVTVDTLRADHLGCYGHALADTPQIDALAASGMRFAHAIAPAPITLPSHATLLTGLAIPRHGVRNNGTFRLEPEVQTLAEMLGDAGYSTAAFVGAFVLESRFGLDQGFGHYDDDVTVDSARLRAGQFNERRAEAVVDAALQWLDGQRDDERWFAWTHFFDPHVPYHAPPEFHKRHAKQPYDGEIAYVDSQLARLIDHLRETDRLDRTVVVVTSDHGEGLGQHGEETHSVLIYDSTLHVPLIVSSPTLFDRPWLVADRVVGLVDVVPTVLSLLGLPAPATSDGVDLLTSSADDDRAVYVESMVPFLNHGWAPLRGVRRLADKLIRAPRPEYYRVLDDPAEQHNLYAETEQSSELEGLLDERLAAWPTALAPETAQIELTPEDRRRLEALGYVRSVDTTRAGERNPVDMMQLWTQMNRGRALSARGRHGEAIELLEQVVAEDPDNGRAWYALSLAFRRAKNAERAEAAIRRGVELLPSAEGFVKLAQFCLQRDDLPCYEDALARAAAREPDFGEIYVTRGDRLARDGRFEDALVEFERALRLDPVRVGELAENKIRQAQWFMEREREAPETSGPGSASETHP